jgi:hypothetical protein
MQEKLQVWHLKKDYEYAFTLFHKTTHGLHWPMKIGPYPNPT